MGKLATSDEFEGKPAPFFDNSPMTSPQLTAEELDRIFAENFLPYKIEHTGSQLDRYKVTEVAFTRAKAAIISWADKRALRIIGEDEDDPNHNAKWQTYRNHLRAEQRAAIKSRIEKERG